MSKLNEIISSRLNESQNKSDYLVNAWGDYIGAVSEHLAKKGKSLTIYDKRNIAQLLENATLETGLRHKSKMFETTYSDNIDFLGIQLPVIAAMLPSLVLNEIATVQALDRRSGAVFFMDVLAGQTKGSVTSGDTLISSVTGQATSTDAKRYASVMIADESLGGSGNSRSGNVAYPYIQAGTLVISNATNGITFTDNGSGVLVSNTSGVSNGTVTYTTGAYSVDFGVSVTGATAAYSYVYDRLATAATSGVPQINLNLTSSTVEAIDFPLQAKYGLGAAIDLQKAHGLIMEDELVKYLAGTIRFEIDHYGIEQIVAAATSAGAATSPGTWTGTPSAGEEWVWKKFQLIDYIEKGNNAIFAKTLRAMATFLVCGNDGARVIRQLAPNFVPDASLGKVVPTGPTVIGRLDGRLVVQDPFLTSTKIYFGFRGSDYLNSGFIFAPYIPLFSTPTLVTSDLQAQKGFLSAVGYKRINDGMFCEMTVSV